VASIRKTGKKYQVRWTGRDKVEHGRTFARSVDARQFKAEIESQINAPGFIDPTASRVTFAEVAEEWLARPDVRESTRERNDQVLRNHVLPEWGHRSLDQITYNDAQRWIHAAMNPPAGRRPLAARTIHKNFAVLKGVLDHAVRSRLIPRNPVDGVKLPKPPADDRRFLDSAQLESLALSTPRHHLAVLILGYLGLRFGELAALRVNDVLFESREIKIDETYSKQGSQWAIGPTKTGATRRVPMPATMVDELQGAVAGKQPSDFVFSTRAGTPLSRHNFTRDVLNPWCATSGVPHLSPHDLRHTAASIAINARLTVLDVQRMLGHAKASTTLDSYSDLFEANLQRIAHTIDEARITVTHG